MKHWLRVAQFLLDPKIAPDASPALFARWAQPLGSVSLGDCKAVGGLSTAPRAASRRLGQHLQSYITEATFESEILLSLSNSANKLVNIPQMINAVQTCTTLVDLEPYSPPESLPKYLPRLSTRDREIGGPWSWLISATDFRWLHA